MDGQDGKQSHCSLRRHSDSSAPHSKMHSTSEKLSTLQRRLSPDAKVKSSPFPSASLSRGALCRKA